MPGSAMEVVDVIRRLVGRLLRGEYSTDISPTIAVDPVAEKAVKGPTRVFLRGPCHRQLQFADYVFSGCSVS